MTWVYGLAAEGEVCTRSGGASSLLVSSMETGVEREDPPKTLTYVAGNHPIWGFCRLTWKWVKYEESIGVRAQTPLRPKVLFFDGSTLPLRKLDIVPYAGMLIMIEIAIRLHVTQDRMS